MANFTTGVRNYNVTQPTVQVSPMVQIGEFNTPLGLGADPNYYVKPGGLDQNATDGFWVTYTRSVLSWDIRVTATAGATLIIEIGTLPDLAALPDGKEVWPWRAVALEGTDAPNVASGIELPGNSLARFNVVIANAALVGNAQGIICLKGV